MKILKRITELETTKSKNNYISDTLNIKDKKTNTLSLNLTEQLVGIPQWGVVPYEGEALPSGYEQIDSIFPNATTDEPGLMTKEDKQKLDSSFGKTITMTKTIFLSAIDTWYDVGVSGADLQTGTYMIEMFCNSSSVPVRNERYSGIMTWYNEGTNGNTACEIQLSDTNNVRYYDGRIKLRTLRQINTPNGLKLQACIKTTPMTTSCEVILKFKRML